MAKTKVITITEISEEKLASQFENAQQIFCVAEDGTINDFTELSPRLFQILAKDIPETTIKTIFNGWEGPVEMDGCAECHNTFMSPNYNYCPVCGQRIGESYREYE